MRLSGTITEWNDDRGFGFITPPSGSERVFVHVSALAPGSRRPGVGSKVTFLLTTDDRKRLRADDVRYAAESGSVTGSVTGRVSGMSPDLLTALIVAGLFLAASVSAALLRILPAWLPVPHLLLSVVTAAAYRSDKQAARRGGARTPEAMLHLLELLGGWPGALVAQRLFRHKCSKVEYQVTFWIIVAVHLGLLGWAAATKPTWLVTGPK